MIRNPEAYLYTVARNLAKEHRVLERRERSTIDVDDAGDLLADLWPTMGGRSKVRRDWEDANPRLAAAMA